MQFCQNAYLYDYNNIIFYYYSISIQWVPISVTPKSYAKSYMLDI